MTSRPSLLWTAIEQGVAARAECLFLGLPHTRVTFDWAGSDGYALSACRMHEAGAAWVYVPMILETRSSGMFSVSRGNARFAVTLRRNEYGEYVARCFEGGQRHTEGDYFTDDEDDAIDTARAMVNHRLTSHFAI